jgi:hypothetical protein
MKLNLKKTQHMLINYNNNNNQPTPAIVHIDKETIEETTEYKYLGIRINNKMNIDNHWLALSQKLGSNIYLYKRLKRLGLKTEKKSQSKPNRLRATASHICTEINKE